MLNKTSIEKLKEYLSNQYGIDPEKINMRTSMLHDLKIFGDDIDELVARLIKDFKIEVKEIDLTRYFVGDEPTDFFSPVLRFFRNERVRNKPSLTIEDILKFIETGILK